MDSTYEIVKELIDFNSEGVHTYNHNGSTWLIFTDQKKWVIELTKEKTLWYNYYFFTGVFKYLSLDVVENQHYITKWVEDNVINGVKEARALDEWVNSEKIVDKTIQNGVKSTKGEYYKEIQKVEYTIQNGVKETKSYVNNDFDMNDAIENGVKHTQGSIFDNPTAVKETIQNGVKYTVPMGKDKDSIVSNDFGMNQTIKNGIKGTYRFGFGNEAEIENAIKNGVKKTYSDKIPHEYDWTEQFTEEIEGIIQNGVKHTEKSLQIDGSCVIEDVIKEGVKHTEYGDWEDGDERLDDILNNGIKETTPGGYLGFVERKGKTVHQFETAKQLYYVEDVIEYGIKKTEGAMLFDESQIDTVISDGIKETHDDVMPHTGRVEGVIKNGVKETVDALSSRLPNPVGDVIKNGVKQCIPSHIPLFNPMDFSIEYCENHRLDDVASVLESGIKEVQPLPSQEGNMDWGNYYYRQPDRTKAHIKYVDDAITNGIKKTISGHADKREFVEKVVLEYSVKETWGYDKQPQIRIDNVIENGIRPTSEM